MQVRERDQRTVAGADTGLPVSIFEVLWQLGMNVVEINNLTKYYGRTKALDEASWSLEQGTLLGFLGPNGSGKSTTIRILLGLLKPSAGRSVVFGLDGWKRSAAIRARVGYLPGDVRLYSNLSGTQMVRFVAGSRRMNGLGDGSLDASTQLLQGNAPKARTDTGHDAPAGSADPR